jgi:hypothetical protein
MMANSAGLAIAAIAVEPNPTGSMTPTDNAAAGRAERRNLPTHLSSEVTRPP